MFKRIFAALLMSASAVASATTVAHVYVQTPNGVMVYTTDSTGMLAVVYGSPFKTVGKAVATNGKYFFSNGLTYIHVYPMNATTGAIGKEVSNINTALYSGQQCGTTGPTTLDHTGSYLYVAHDNATGNNGTVPCWALQSYRINNTNGQITFVGDATSGYNEYAMTFYAPPPTITANNTFAYAALSGGFGGSTATFKRSNVGSFDSLSTYNIYSPPVYTNDPSGFGGSWSWSYLAFAADPTNHVAAVMMQESYPGDCACLAYPEVASFTSDSSGNLRTTNTYQTMATPNVYPGVMGMSPSGALLAIGSNVDYNKQCGASCSSVGPYYWGTSGLQILHFNGANPPTKFSGTLTTDPIDYIAWDRANHIYAVSKSLGEMYVFTVTPTSITKVVGSPFNIGTNPTNLIVR